MELLERMLGRQENGVSSALESEQNDDSDTTNGSLEQVRSTQPSAADAYNHLSQFEVPMQQAAPSVANESLGLDRDTDVNTIGTYNHLSPFDTTVQQVAPTASNVEASSLQPLDSPPNWEHRPASPSPRVDKTSRSKRIVDFLLSTDGHLSYCKRNGQTRYYAPTTNIHVYSDLASDSAPPIEWEQKKRVARVLDNRQHLT
jgi:hypothetical protein